MTVNRCPSGVWPVLAGADVPGGGASYPVWRRSYVHCPRCARSVVLGRSHCGQEPAAGCGYDERPGNASFSARSAGGAIVGGAAIAPARSRGGPGDDMDGTRNRARNAGAVEPAASSPAEAAGGDHGFDPQRAGIYKCIAAYRSSATCYCLKGRIKYVATYAGRGTEGAALAGADRCYQPGRAGGGRECDDNRLTAVARPAGSEGQSARSASHQRGMRRRPMTSERA